MSEYSNAINKLFDELEANLARELDAVSDEDGQAPVHAVDQILAKQNELIDRMANRLIEAVRERDPAAAEIVRAEIEPFRVAFQKRAMDLVRPH